MCIVLWCGVYEIGGETHPFSVVPDSSNASTESDTSACPLAIHVSGESCCHCCYVAGTALFPDATLPHPRHPEICEHKPHHNPET